MTENSPRDDKVSSPLRRRVLQWILNGGTFTLLGSTIYPILRFVMPPAVSEAATSSVVAGQVGELKPNAGKIFRFGQRPGLLVMTPEGQYRAFSAVCPHLQCTVQYREDMSQIWCACHNGIFDINGKVVSGPPPEGLEEFKVDLRGEEIVASRV